MDKSKVILVWGSEDILSSSIELVLASKQDWNVLKVTDEEDTRALVQRVRTAEPEIVIICLKGYSSHNSLPLQNLLQENPDIKVITISLESNAMDVYTRQKILVTKTSDLLATIESSI